MRRIAALLLLLALPAWAQSPLGPQARSYYYQNGPVVRLYDGGTGSRNAYDARLALAVPWKWGPDSISAGWIMSGSLITPYTIMNDTLARFVASFDTTRKAQLDASLISASTTRKFQFPNKAGTFAMVSDLSDLSGQDVLVGGTHTFCILDATGINETCISTAAALARAAKFPDADGSILLHAATQPVGSKTLYTSNTINARDDRFTLKASGDTTKTLAVNLSLLTAARIDSMPDVSGRRILRIYHRDFTGQTADLGSQTMLTSPAAGQYEITAYLEDTTIGVGTEVVTFSWTDDVGPTTDATTSLSLAGTGHVGKIVPAYVASGNLTFATSGYVSGTFALRLSVRGPL